MSKKYEESGVSLEAGYKSVELIKKHVARTKNLGMLSAIGGFGGAFDLSVYDFKNPVLVSGTDGVGTKVKLAQMMDIHNTVGIDCVAMCVNDILCQGAKPLFFLDYIATGKLVAEKMASIVEGVAEGCIQAGCALIGGETAEMPGIYKEEDYDIAGFCVGVVEKEKIIDGKKNVKKGNIILALPSSGVHSNGFSLVRKIIFDHKNFSLNDVTETGKTLGEELLIPTKIYAKQVVNLLEKFNVNGLCHITGGGLYENVPRVLGEDVDAKIFEKNIPQKEIFTLLQKWGEISKEEMYGTFNMGIGMLIFVEKEDVDGIKTLFADMNEEIYEVGEVVEGNSKVILY